MENTWDCVPARVPLIDVRWIDGFHVAVVDESDDNALAIDAFHAPAIEVPFVLEQNQL